MVCRLFNAAYPPGTCRQHVVRLYRTVGQATLDPSNPLHAPSFDDFYFSTKDPVGERRKVFIDAQDLVARFQELRTGQIIRIGETGFGTGLTFLLTASLFITHAPLNARLQWISTEYHCLTREDLKRLHQAIAWPPGLDQLAKTLRADWPVRVGCCHRRLFGTGQICLDLHFGDASEVFSDLTGRIDAWCLDGFSPNRNPDMWSESLFQSMARLSDQHTTLATFSAARTVRDGLQEAGFEMTKHPGFAGKRERMTGRFTRHVQTDWMAPPIRSNAPQTVTIIGAGLSGAWMAHALARRGIACTVFDRANPGQAASGNTQGITYAKLGIEATPASLIQLQALASTHTLFSSLDASNDWHPTGVLLLSLSTAGETQQQKLVQALNPPEALMRAVDQSEASDLAHQALASGGLWLPTGGWLNPSTSCHTLLAHPLIDVKSSHALTGLESDGDIHRLHFQTAAGETLIHDCEHVILANALDVMQFSPTPLPLKPVKGQITQLTCARSVAVPVCGDAYIAPAVDGVATCGATYHPKQQDTAIDPADDVVNLNQTNALFQEPLFATDSIAGHRAAVRTTTPDYAPVAGQLAQTAQWDDFLRALSVDATSAPQAPLPFATGLYALTGQGSRGTLTAPVTAEIVVSQLLGEVLPVSKTIYAGLAPDRFIRRNHIRGIS